MNRTYETTNAAPINYNDSATYQVRDVPYRPMGENTANSQQTELESLLGTLRSQAIEISINVAQLCDRISPRPEETSDGSKACFGSGYVGQAEEVRSIQAGTARMLAELSKYA